MALMIISQRIIPLLFLLCFTFSSLGSPLTPCFHFPTALTTSFAFPCDWSVSLMSSFDAELPDGLNGELVRALALDVKSSILYNGLVSLSLLSSPLIPVVWAI